jgi:NDP-4-keto-2,6-dideoxyhexose 3-C-methyltransferase
MTDSMYKTISKCRICGGPLTSLINLGDQALTGVFPKTKAEYVATGPLELVRCSDLNGCGLVQLRQSYDLELMYGMNYGYRSGLNPSMVSHLKNKVSHILKIAKPKSQSLVIDVGSNDGTTLLAYPQGDFRLVGVDPTGSKFAEFYTENIDLIPHFFSAKLIEKHYPNQKASIITSFSMFYDLEDPIAFAKEVESTLDEDGIWVFEQSYLPTMINTNSFDTICHEHLEFYAMKQISWILKAAGLKVLDVELNDVNGGSFSIVACKISSNRTPNLKAINSVVEGEAILGLDKNETYDAFKTRVDLACTRLVEFLTAAKANGELVCGLGASTKGNVLLQYCGIGPELLPMIGEVNPDKFGSFTPGTLIPLVPESEVLALRPDYLLVLPWHFRSFFERQESFFGKTLVFPLPQLCFISPTH